LKKSKMKTGMNHGVPRTRATLVAPMFPDPIVRMSLPVFSLTTMYPAGIAPTK
jgi:hypothetical protein